MNSGPTERSKRGQFRCKRLPGPHVDDLLRAFHVGTAAEWVSIVREQHASPVRREPGRGRPGGNGEAIAPTRRLSATTVALSRSTAPSTVGRRPEQIDVVDADLMCQRRDNFMAGIDAPNVNGGRRIRTEIEPVGNGLTVADNEGELIANWGEDRLIDWPTREPRRAVGSMPHSVLTFHTCATRVVPPEPIYPALVKISDDDVPNAIIRRLPSALNCRLTVSPGIGTAAESRCSPLRGRSANAARLSYMSTMASRLASVPGRQHSGAEFAATAKPAGRIRSVRHQWPGRSTNCGVHRRAAGKRGENVTTVRTESSQGW